MYWTSEPENNFFCPKLALLGHFLAKNGHFLGRAVLNHFLGFQPCNTCFCLFSTCKMGWGGVELTTRSQRTLFLAENWHF